jgi:hypothetical protein
MRFLVTQPPGAPIPGVGFVKPGEIFHAPDPKEFPEWTPSRTYKPCDEEAQALLKRVHKVDVPLFEKPTEAPKVEHGATMRELAELAAEASGPASNGQKSTAPSKGGDRKL